MNTWKRSFLFTLVVIALIPTAAFAQDESQRTETTDRHRITTTIKTEKNGDIFLVHEMTINAPVEAVWAAFATTEGWTSWSVPVGKVDLKIGGLIQSNYRPDGKLTDEDTITLHIINYVPQRALTLQAELGPHFPDVLKSREKQMYNLITFDPINKRKTKLVSYGIGYKDTPELQKMLHFFVKGNEQSYEQLIKYLETGAANPHTVSGAAE
jgi:uncharacterized protein YndB with AHSA1/START domain